MKEQNRNTYQREYYKRNQERLREYKRQKWQEYYTRDKAQLLAKGNLQRWVMKKEVLTHYGNGICACVKCGFDDLRALTIDHINGGGHKERKQLGKGMDRGGMTFYRWLRKNGYPEGYQTLCMNCQFIKQVKFSMSLLE